jgi:hypothetical protein
MNIEKTILEELYPGTMFFDSRQAHPASLQMSFQFGVAESPQGGQLDGFFVEMGHGKVLVGGLESIPNSMAKTLRNLRKVHGTWKASTAFRPPKAN